MTPLKKQLEASPAQVFQEMSQTSLAKKQP